MQSFLFFFLFPFFLSIDCQLPLQFSFQFTQTDDYSGAQFGFSSAFQNNLLVVGAPKTDLPGPIVDAGAAYIFNQTNGVWSQIQKLSASDALQNDNFGYAVATDGNVIVIGVPTNPHGINYGKVYIFLQNGNRWIQSQILTENVQASGGIFFGDVEMATNFFR